MRPFVLRRRWLMQTQFGRRVPLIIGGIWQSAWLSCSLQPELPRTHQRTRLSVTVRMSGLISNARIDHTHSDDRFRMHVHLGLRNYLGPVRRPLPPHTFPANHVPRGIWILIGETLPTRTRAKQGALAIASNWLWYFLLAFFTPFIVGDIHYKYGYIFACTSPSPFFPPNPT